MLNFAVRDCAKRKELIDDDRLSLEHGNAPGVHPGNFRFIRSLEAFEV
jgi:hypothetical protein